MYTVEQYFNIYSITIQNIANSSVFQIGTSGVIQAQSHVSKPSDAESPDYNPLEGEFVVPLPNPT